jgi:FkbM family methyltransferase
VQHHSPTLWQIDGSSKGCGTIYPVPDRENAGVSAFLRSQLRPGMVVIDVGANVGDVAAVAAECVTASGRVIAFEASPDNARLLRERFGALPQVDVRHAAVSDQSGTLMLHLDAKSSKRHSLFEAAVSVRGSSVTVPAITLDDVRRELPRVDLLKIDAQGAEGRIVAGGRTLLQRDLPVVLFELWPRGMLAAGTAPAELFEVFDRLGYRCVRLSVKGRQKSRDSIDTFLASATKWACTNVIAWPPRRRPSLAQRLIHRLHG